MLLPFFGFRDPCISLAAIYLCPVSFLIIIFLCSQEIQVFHLLFSVFVAFRAFDHLLFTFADPSISHVCHNVWLDIATIQCLFSGFPIQYLETE